MTANFDNSAAAIPGVIRDAATGVTWVINADGSPKITATGVADSQPTGQSIDITQASISGVIRDAVTGRPLVVNADGSINMVVT